MPEHTPIEEGAPARKRRACYIKKRLAVSIGQHSSAGRKPANQDFHGALVPDEPLLSSKGIAVALADGISSSDVSHIASETAVKGFLHDYYSTSDAWSVKTSAQRVLQATNFWLYAQTRNSPNRYNKDKGYICAFSALVLKSNTAHLFHSGDARIYRVTGRLLEQLTEDHRNVLTADRHYLTRALGFHDGLEMDYSSLPVDVGDTFVLATDGVYEFVAPATIAETIAHASDLDVAARELVRNAYDAGSDDNLTIQIIRLEDLPGEQVGEVQNRAQSLPPAPQLSARMEFDGYRIIRDLHLSSRSHVFLAEDLNTGESVVIKTPSMAMRNDREHLEKFLMEDWIARRLNNAHILRATRSTRKQNYLYLVTEYIEGQTLAQWMIDNPSPPMGSVREIVSQIGRGLQVFHRQEMVHQDLRPENIMIDKTGTVKIIDFGATRVAGISECVGQDDRILGTAQYTAPEYYLGFAGTPQADIFSLGVITYKMLSGKLPYGNAVSATRNRRSQAKLRYRPLGDNDESTPAWVDYAIGKAVNVEPHKRYDEVSEFIHELSKPASAYRVTARPPLLERNPVLFWQCLCIALAAVLIFQNVF